MSAPLSSEPKLAPYIVCSGCGGVFNKTRDGLVPQHFVQVPPEYIPRFVQVITQGLGTLGRPRGVKYGAEADEVMRRWCELHGGALPTEPLHWNCTHLNITGWGTKDAQCIDCGASVNGEPAT